MNSSQRLTLSWLTPGVYAVAAVVSFLHFRVPIPHPRVVFWVAIAFACMAAAFHGRPVTALYLVVELLATTVVVWGSDGIRSPLMLLYLVFILETSVGFGHPWGVASATASVILMWLTGTGGGVSVADVDRLIATWPFFLVVGLMTSLLADSAVRQQARVAVEEHHRDLEMGIAAEIQRYLLPTRPPLLDGFSFHWVLRPALRIGGDFVQFVEQPGALTCVIADVTGHGVPAALLLGSLHELVLRYAGLSPDEAVTAINRSLCESTPEGVSVSLVMLRIGTQGEVLFTNAGHPHPIVRHADGTQEAWPSQDLLAGWFPETTFRLHRRHIEPGDVLLLYTDGLPDTLTGKARRLGESGIQALLQPPAAELQEVAGRLVEAVAQGEQVDDVTVLLLRRDQRR